MSAESTAILIVGTPRSGTTWLAKILDSHPDTLYRHEPDEIVPAVEPMQRSVAQWVRQRDARTAGKRPFFAKSWQSAPARWLRAGLVYAGAAAERARLPAWPIPDLGDASRSRIVIKSVRLGAAIGDFARAFPDGRALLILRHPCGQIASVMRGTHDGRFDLAEAGTDMPFDEATAISFAARFGVDKPAFQLLPDAAKYAWSWRAFNEPTASSVAGLGNAQIVIYEELCNEPERHSRAILDFAGLPWCDAVAGFLARSTRFTGPGGYYAVMRNSIVAAEAWRQSMPEADQEAIRDVVRDSPLAHHWADLTR